MPWALVVGTGDITLEVSGHGVFTVNLGGLFFNEYPTIGTMAEHFRKDLSLVVSEVLQEHRRTPVPPRREEDSVVASSRPFQTTASGTSFHVGADGL